MFTSKRSAPTAVIDELSSDPHRFEFFQAVRWLERWYSQRHGLSSAEVMARRIAFRNSLSLARHAERLGGNPRLSYAYANWRRFPAAKQQAIRAEAVRVFERLQEGTL